MSPELAAELRSLMDQYSLTHSQWRTAVDACNQAEQQKRSLSEDLKGKAAYLARILQKHRLENVSHGGKVYGYRAWYSNDQNPDLTVENVVELP